MIDRVLNYVVKDLLTQRNMKTVPETATVIVALQIMEDLEVSALPVINEEGAFVGVLSRTDIASIRFVRHLLQRPLTKLRVKDLMNRTPPISVNENRPVSEVISTMHNRHIHRVFVHDNDEQIVGVITTTDILKLLFIEHVQSEAYQNEEQHQLFNRVQKSHDRHMEDMGWRSL